jgi:hypothetical protein
MYFDVLNNNEPNICSYDIYMAYKNNGLGLNGSGGYQGLNVNAIGYPLNPLLKNILNNDLFLLRSGAGSIDYITIISKQADYIRCIIHDKIG